MIRALVRSLITCLALLAGPAAAAAPAPPPGRETPAATAAQTAVHLLDYVGVDYAEAVADGKVKNEDEFKEMLEFTGQITGLLESLPPVPQQPALMGQAESLARRVSDKAPAAEIAAEAGKLRWAVIAAYGIQVAPKSSPGSRRRGKVIPIVVRRLPWGRRPGRRSRRSQARARAVQFSRRRAHGTEERVRSLQRDLPRAWPAPPWSHSGSFPTQSAGLSPSTLQDFRSTRLENGAKRCGGPARAGNRFPT